ncbi:tRNA pseudouridine(55) synthase TruB [uncultured Anaerococcus sp.]|uniref:tRNA pseudouridine(55) synthase TruB n=1 Tax=uncultured Anaerococcus sp. TaxID=293428 RepID=UPI00261B153C|nr:tRNA pseudouridine(55) synthase TruB [uncultured Anaerococcus sp.]
MHSGILNINKKKGISSARCVSLVRKALNQKKVGHTGTLDLEASGVLPIVVGKATRVSDYMMGKDKTYRSLIEFGKKTDTLDGAGKVIGQSSKTITRMDLEKALEKFRGEITQIPPMYSALKVGGKKLYDLARAGVEIDRKKRKVTIYDIKLIDFDFPYANIEVTCSKGTYIRTLVDDLGEYLETYAYVKELSRTRVGDFLLEDAIKSDDILEIGKDSLIGRLESIDKALDNFPSYGLEKKYFDQVINGMTIKIEDEINSLARIYVGEEFIGLGKSIKSKDGYFLKMEKVFYDRQD